MPSRRSVRTTASTRSSCPSPSSRTSTCATATPSPPAARASCPGEQVGIVQCAREAGGEAREQRAGIDACNIGHGAVRQRRRRGRGHRHLPGAADPHDTGHRHGGLRARGGALHRRDGRHRRLRPVRRLRRHLRGRRRADRHPDRHASRPPRASPTATSCTSRARASSPTRPCMLSVCSIDPAGCWSTGEPIELDGEDVQDARLGDEYGGGYVVHRAARRRRRPRQRRRAGVAVPPRPRPRLLHRLRGERVPPARRPPTSATRPAPAILGFAPGGAGPQPPAVAVDPTRRPRSRATRSSCEAPASTRARYFYVSLCAAPAGRPEQRRVAASGDGGRRADRRRRRLRRRCSRCPILATWARWSTAGWPPRPRARAEPARAPRPARRRPTCDGVELVCSIRVESYHGRRWRPVRRSSPPEPVRVTFRR